MAFLVETKAILAPDSSTHNNLRALRHREMCFCVLQNRNLGFVTRKLKVRFDENQRNSQGGKRWLWGCSKISAYLYLSVGKIHFPVAEKCQ